MKPTSQNTRILRELRAHNDLTAMEIIQKCGTTNPRARIAELRGYGHDIQNVTVERKGKVITAFRLEGK